ncbi:hypothetical protein GCM10018793_59960 [Streptomyces sulfonofaciens]|uniref:Mannosylglycerate hydrolase MGH1-like glycoside hydrolase domain-containing protein n=1 Tax=Streptomyces sulfonofaciens TaxID=68272 RepID=A0A919GLS4_9ACTN|nr:hypothetical protein [Streptomyces sulfonofaciens]GHH86766.1 hypothetical protein GCM10018793_59960 [Streptomyces sulfonofaciens]
MTRTALGAPATPIPTGRSQRSSAVSVLLSHWTGSGTVPSLTLYPHQWSWDSAFIAIGLRRLSPYRAQRELETLCGAQWGDGRIPHIVFNPAVPPGAYFPGPAFWRSGQAGAAAGAPAGIDTSGIVQPPVHALAAWLVHESDPELSRRRGFLARLYPRLAAWHGYLADHRDLGGQGLAAVVHPWESGMDNSPCWDGPLARVEPAPTGSFRRADLTHGAAADRPTDEDYGRYVGLAARYRDQHYRDTAASHPFAVEDPAFNAFLAVSEHALASIAQSLGRSPVPHRARAGALTEALVARLWDPQSGQFLCRDLVPDALVAERSVSGLLPLAVPGLPDPVVRALLDTLSGPHFDLGAGSTGLVPSYDLLGGAHDASRYWRGPAWFNVNWTLERGLRQYGARAAADRLAGAILTTATASGFAEYVDARTGQALGSRDFGWTAAMALDVLARS